jgi:RNA polymerase sigma-70 factor, ECF subfamily
MEQSEQFEALQPKLFAIAYRMLGSVMEAEDIVQEAYLRFRAAEKEPGQEPIRSPEAFLRTVVTRLCLDQLKSARAQRESYIGPWLPEPLVMADPSKMADPAEQACQYDSISMAFMFLLETLSPEERAVFLLREVFDYEYSEIAPIIGKTDTACRQILSRAKKHVTEHRPRYKSSLEHHQQIMMQFFQAAELGDLDGLMALLTDDVLVVADGGGKAAASKKVLQGRKAAGRFLQNIGRSLTPGFTFEIALINGYPGIMFWEGSEQITTVLTLDVTAEGIRGIYFVRNPDKLKHLR